MQLNTASAIISFYDKLEEKALQFYESLMKKEEYPDSKETFLVFASDNKKHRAMVRRVYREVITDAIEACFSFKGLNERDYRIETKLRDDLNYSDILRKALEIEKKINKFCIEASKESRDLLPDISYVFERVAKRKASHILTLESLLGEP